MRFLEEFRDPETARGLLDSIRVMARGLPQVRLMEVCGTHTVSIFRYGIRDLLPENIRLISGPGCPVCVTPSVFLDQAICIAREPDVTLVSFGDMMRIPGSESSLEMERARGRDVRVVYSPLDALQIARENPSRLVVFLGVGFETTAPAVGVTLLRAKAEGIGNFLVLGAHKRIVPAMEALLKTEGFSLDGFICPPHVSAVIGSRPYQVLAESWNMPCVVTGFEPLDILQGIHMLLEQILAGEHKVQVQYRRAVPNGGNPAAMRVMEEVFQVKESLWRGLGKIAKSGLEIHEGFSHFDAMVRFQPQITEALDPPGCQCGDVLRGVLEPWNCKMFGTLCTPQRPLGPCMVSGEGTCAAHFKYGWKLLQKNKAGFKGGHRGQ
ncbi:MAG: hydrogenase formation protein HypD [bacterium]